MSASKGITSDGARQSSTRLFRIIAIAGLLTLAVTRWTLIDRGHFYWYDERCYLPAENFVEAVGAGEWRHAARHLFVAGIGFPPARPGFVMISAVPVLLRQAFLPWSEGASILETYGPAAAFNIPVSLAISLCVFWLARSWLSSRWLALVACTIYSLTAGATIWLRHLVPYNESLLLGLIALVVISATKSASAPGPRRTGIAGLLCGLAFACYPGHYLIVMINGLVVFFCSRNRWRSSLMFAAGFAVVIGLFESAAYAAGRSYLGDLSRLSGAITMGDPQEGYHFAWRYLRDVEGLAGLMIAVGTIACLPCVLLSRSCSLKRPARVAIAAALLAYMFHASMGVFAGRLVFYGRVLMVFLPIAVIAAVVPLTAVRAPRLQGVIAAVLVVVSLSSHVVFRRDYGPLRYPADLLTDAMQEMGRDVAYEPHALWALGYLGETQTLEATDPEVANVVDTQPAGSEVFVKLAPHDLVGRSRPRYLGVNLKWMGYIPKEETRFEVPEGYELIASAAHPETLPAIRFEGRKPWERRRLRERQYAMRVYTERTTAE